jgi:amino acid transporter
MIFNVVYALGELACMYPVSGGFYTYSSRFIDPSWGFAMVCLAQCSSSTFRLCSPTFQGWNYVMQWAVVLPLELVVAGLVMDYLDTGVPVA